MNHLPKAAIPTRYLFGIFFVSSAALMFEVALSRLLSITLWHHFAFLIISCALLGYGAAGSWLSVFGRPKQPYTPAILFSVLVLPIFLIVNRLPFDPALITLNPLQGLIICFSFILLAIPFFLAGLTISRLLQLWPSQPFRLYSSDLLGAAAGCLLFFGFAPLLNEIFWLVVIAGFGLCGCILLSDNSRHLILSFAAPAGVMVPLLIFGASGMKISDYKALTLALKNPGAEFIETRWNAVTRIDWFRSPLARFAPGLSLNYSGSLPAQIGITIDGDRLSAFTPWVDSDRTFYRHLPTRLLFHFEPRPDSVLILQVVGGQDINIALDAKVDKIAVQTGNALLGKWLANKIRAPNVSMTAEKVRTFLATDPDKYDRIVASLEGALPTGGTGISSLAETSLESVEGIKALIFHLKPGGWLSFHRYLIPPPRAEFRLVTTLVTVLSQLGYEPAEHLAVFRTISTIMFLVHKDVWTAAEKSQFREFCDQMGYTPVYYPGMPMREANRTNRFSTAVYATAIREILKSPGRFIDDSIFDLKPVSDDNPFFYHFLRLNKTVPYFEVFDGKWEALIEGGLLLPLLFFMTLVLSFAMIVLPLWITGKTAFGLAPGMSYFLWLGFGFMMVEIAFFERLTHFLGSPTYSFALVLGCLLVSSGLGAKTGERLSENLKSVGHLILLFLLCLYYFAFHVVLSVFEGEGFFSRLLITTLLIFLPGILMGILFPRGINRLRGESDVENRISMAWCFNSFASVLGSVGAMVLAIFGGLSSLFLWAALLYSLAWVAYRRFDR